MLLKLRRKKLLLRLGVLLLALIVIPLVVMLVQSVRMWRVTGNVLGLMDGGYFAVAADEVDSYRYKLVKSEDDCKMLIAVYYYAKRAERLEWCAERCMANGFKGSNVMIGLALGRSLAGRDDDALVVLDLLLQKDSSNSEAMLHMAEILLKKRQNDQAGKFFMKAARLAPKDTAILSAALKFFIGVRDWQRARELADYVRALDAPSYALKLHAARALIGAGDTVGAESLKEQVLLQVKGNQQLKNKLILSFPDLFKPFSFMPVVPQKPGG